MEVAFLNEKFPNADSRLGFAYDIQAYWENFRGRIPRLSPSEESWLEGELNAGREFENKDRFFRAVASKEYALRSLHRHSEMCLKIVSRVIQSFESEGGQGSKFQKSEMLNWVLLVNCYDGTNDMESNLSTAGIPYDDKTGESIQTPIGNHVQRTIVNKVVPAAMAETMGWNLK